MKSEAYVKALKSWFFIAATRGRPLWLSKTPHLPLCPIVVSPVSYCTSCTRFIIHIGTYILDVIKPSEQISNTYFHQATKRQNAEAGKESLHKEDSDHKEGTINSFHNLQAPPTIFTLVFISLLIIQY